MVRLLVRPSVARSYPGGKTLQCPHSLPPSPLEGGGAYNGSRTIRNEQGISTVGKGRGEKICRLF
ncbi:MAG: hypothetical protein D6812_16570 [Deltaproteobacteria bacterium]|nr:MAG: hypothetical protein D6812_16570 [Deltaproteobacteria bacterium]